MICRSTSCASSPPPAPAIARNAPRPVSDVLFDQIVKEGQSFWSAVYAPFISRDLTRDDLRGLVKKGLERTAGNYKVLVELFNMPPDDYKRFLGFLRKYHCHMPFQQFRSAAAAAGRPAMPNLRLPAALRHPRSCHGASGL